MILLRQNTKEKIQKTKACPEYFNELSTGFSEEKKYKKRNGVWKYRCIGDVEEVEVKVEELRIVNFELGIVFQLQFNFPSGFF